jgi:uncharacterized protein (DUF488 family)
VRVRTIGHGTKPASELIETLRLGCVETLVDVRRYPGSRRSPHFNGPALATALADVGVAYVHSADLGGRRSGVAGEERFGCLRVAAFASYAAWMSTPAWQAALASALELPQPCLMCAETLPWRCHRRLIADVLAARGHEIVHLVAPGETRGHRPFAESDFRDGELYLCGERVA